MNMSLLEAAGNGNADQVKHLLAEGTSVDQVNAYGDTSLHFASMRGHTEVGKPPKGIRNHIFFFISTMLMVYRLSKVYKPNLPTN